MKETKKTAIIVAVIMIAVGIVSSVCAIAAMSFDFAKINTVAFEINTYTVDDTSPLPESGLKSGMRTPWNWALPKENG